MYFTTSTWKPFAGQNDVQAGLHVPMVYENVPSQPQTWEYRIVSVDTREEALPDTAQLNELGNQGWLLVGVLEQKVHENHSRINYYFFRQKEA